MKQVLLLLVAFSSYPVFSWECHGIDESNIIESSWSVADRVFTGTVVEARYFPRSSYDRKFEYMVEVDEVLKGDAADFITLAGDEYSPEISIGRNHVFFLQAEDQVNLCTLVLRFETHWADREDIVKSTYVREILRLANEKH